MSGKALLLENGFEIDIPKEFIRYLEKNKIEWTWYDTRFSFWKENREATIKFFSELPKGQLIVCSTVFDGYQQLELFINLLHSLPEKEFTFKIMHGCLAEDLLKWYDDYESSITPNTEEYNYDPTKRKKFKEEMNRKFREVLKTHKIYWIYKYGDDRHLRNINAIKKYAE